MADSATRVIAASRGKTTLMCLGSIAAAAIGGWLKEYPSEKAFLAGWAMLGLFSLVGLMAALQLVWPPRLVLRAEGIAFHYLFATFRRNWVDVDQIVIVQIESTKFVKLVTKLGVSDLALGGAWPVSADELVSVLEDYVARFGRGNAT